MSVPANLDKVAGSETDLPAKEINEVRTGLLVQVDSGHLTNSSQQSLHRQALSSESDCDYSDAFEYDADDESDNCFKEDLAGSIDHVYHSQVFLADKAIQLLQMRPKISERILESDNDTDEEFHESEYDVIDSDNDDCFFRSRRKLSSSSKKKLSRSLSDVKLRRRPSRTNMSRDVKEPRASVHSLPDIPVCPVKKTGKSSGNVRLKRLSVHREDVEKVRVNFEGFTTSGSVSKCNKSDDADESFAPNSEIDCYSTWNTSPPKMVNGNIDSSEIEASLELKARTSSVARNLFKRIISKHDHRLYDEMPTTVSGRFKVSVIREEENVSRRGSGSSNELTLKMHPLKDNQGAKGNLEQGTAVAEAVQFVIAPDLLDFSEAPSLINSSFSSRNESGRGSGNMIEQCVSNSEKEEETILTASEQMDEVQSLYTLAEKSLRTTKYFIGESALDMGEQQSVGEEKDTRSIRAGSISCSSNEHLPTDCVGESVTEATVEGCAIVINGRTLETSAEKESAPHISNEEDRAHDTTGYTHTSDLHLQTEQYTISDALNQNKRNSNGMILLEAAEAFFRDFSASDKLLNICGVDMGTCGNGSKLQREKVRSVSPSLAVLGTYDVIPDVTSYVLDDYEILSDKRE